MSAEGLPARKAALHTIYRVNEQGAWSNILIEGELSRTRLKGPDRGFFVRLVRGVLERQGALDWALGLCLHRSLSGLEPWPRELLRLGAYQILFTDVPGFAAVDTTVALAKGLVGRPVSGLVNAALRRLARERTRLPWPDRTVDPLGYLSTRESHPRWLVERWLQRFGVEASVALCAANNTPPVLTVRTNLLRTSRQLLAATLAEAGYVVRESRLTPEALYLQGEGYLRNLAAYREGLFIVQDEASMLAARALGPLPGEKVVDACAAPGGKTTHLAALAGDQAQVLAIDINQNKLSQVKARAARLGLESIRTLHGDARRLGEIAPAGFDAAMLDAPCSGLGVIRRRPELRWRRHQGELAQLQTKQLELLAGVAAAVRAGGRLAYAVCSFEREETEDVLLGFLSSLAGHDWRMCGEPRVLLPHIDGTDGFFFAVMQRQQV